MTTTVLTGLSQPCGLAVDSAGNVYFSQTGSGGYQFGPGAYEIEAVNGKASPSSTVVGLGSPADIGACGVGVDFSGNVFVGYAVAGGFPTDVSGKPGVGAFPGTGANPVSGVNLAVGTTVTEVAVSSNGNLFFLDGNLVREVADSPVFSSESDSSVWDTFGGGTDDASGVAVDGSGNVYVTSQTANGIFEILSSSGQVSSSSTITEVVSGYAPTAITADTAGDLYFVDSSTNAIWEYVAPAISGPGGETGGQLKLVTSIFTQPVALAIDGHGNLFVADAGGATGTGTIYEYSSTVNFGSVQVGSTSSTVSLHYTAGATLNSTTPYQVLTQGAAGQDFAAVATGTTCSGTIVATGCVVNVAFSPKSAGLRMGAVELENSSGAAIATTYLYGTGTAPEVTFSPVTKTLLGGGFGAPSGVATDTSGNLYISDSVNKAVYEMPASCTSSSYTAGSCSTTSLGGGFNTPEGLAVDGAGNVYVGDQGNNAVYKIPAGCTSTLYTAGSCTTTSMGGGFNWPMDVAVDGGGNIYVADELNNAVKEMPADCTSSSCVTSLGGGFRDPQGIAVDSSGNIYVADTNNHAVKEMPAGCASSACTTSMGDFPAYPKGLAVDASGNIDVVANAAEAVEVPAGCTTADMTAGSCSESILANGFHNPFGIALDQSGNLYITDSGHGQADKLDGRDAPSLSFASTAVGSTSAAQTVTLNNVGNAALTFSVPTSGTNPSVAANFSLGTSSCPQLDATSSAQTLAAGTSCDLNLEFAPTEAGSISGSLVETDNALNTANATQSISLSGTATPGSQTITFANPGTQNFSAPPTLSATASSGLTVTFASTTASVCTVTTGGALTFVSTGTCSINADQVGNANYDAAPTVTQSFSVLSVPGAPTIGTATASVAAGGVGTATVSFTAPASDGGAAITGYTASSSPAGLSGACTNSPCTVTGLAAGTSYTFAVTATNSIGTGAASSVSNAVSIATPALVVTTAADDAGTASNCTAQSSTTTGTDASCSLRDALLYASNAGGANIYFDSTNDFLASNTAAQNTIALGTAGELNIPANTAIQGATSGSGMTLTNLVTVSGSGSYRVFNVAGVTGTSIANLMIAAGANGVGGGIYNSGTLTIAASTVSGNSASSGGGGIYNSGTLTVNNSAISGNSINSVRLSARGNGIVNVGTLTVSDSTISGNHGGGEGGGIWSSGPLTVTNSTISNNSTEGYGGGISAVGFKLANSIVAGNSVVAGNYADIDGSYTDNGGNLAGIGASATSTIAASLSSLDNFGGPTETMIPLPGSPAICAGVQANLRGSTDQRGAANTNTGYISGATCVDAGAVQTDYSLAFVQQPPANTAVHASMLPAPTVELEENGNPFEAAAETVPLTLTGNGALTGGSAATSTSTGIAAYSGLNVSAAGAGDSLTARLVLNSAVTPTAPAISAISSTFTVGTPVTQLAFSTAPAENVLVGGNAGGAVTVDEEAADGSLVTTAADTITLAVTGPNSYSQTYTATASGGAAAFNLSSAALTALGTYTYTATSGSLTQAAASETVLASSVNVSTSQNVNSATAPQTVTLYIAAAGTVNAVNVLTQGSSGLDFMQAASPNGGTCAIGTTYSVRQACTVNVIFTPKYPGLRLGVVQLTDSSGTLLGRVLLSGTGAGPQAALTPGTINTIAGNNNLSGYSGDGGQATSASIAAKGVAVDSAGNLYIADTFNNVIRKVNASTGIITTVAGGGSPFDGIGDGLAATSAEFYLPNGIAVDGAGDLYIADTGDNRIREVNAATGIISTIAGGGSPASGNGDGGPATGAELNTPEAVAVDRAGNIYIADTSNNAIREVNASTGIITTVAGNGTSGYSGDGAAATSAALNLPTTVAIDSAGNLYIADTYNNVIREVNVSTGFITTVAGNGYQAGTGQGGYSGDGAAATGAELNQPTGVALDSAGDLYISDDANAVIRKVNASTGLITTIAGNQPNGPGYSGDGGAATSASLNDAFAIALDGAGNIYIADGFNRVIREVNVSAVPTVSYPTSTAVNSTDTTDGSQTVALSNIGNQQLNLSGLTVPASWTQVSSGATDCSSTSQVAAGGACNLALIFAPTAPGNPLTDNVTLTDNALNAANTTQLIPLSGTAIAEPKLVFSTAPNATILVGEDAGVAVRVDEEAFDGSPLTGASDAITLTVTGPNSYSQTYTMTASSGEATFNLSSATLTTAGTYTYTATSGSMTQAVATETVLSDPPGFASSTSFRSSTNVGSTASGQAVTVYFLVAGTVNTVNVLTQGTPGLDFTQAASPNGGTCAIGTAYSAGQSCTVNVIFTPKSPGQRFGAIQLTDNSGNLLGQVLLAATGTAPELALTPGTVNTVAGNNAAQGYSGDGGPAASAGLSAPNGVALDSAGNLYIADAANSVIRKVNASTGLISTIAGNQPNPGYSGDGGPATSAGLSSPANIAVDGAGNLYIADTGNNVIREVNASTGIITTVAGNGSQGYSGDGGPATSAELNGPDDVVVDGAGNLYIADTGNSVIREVNASMGIITTVAGNGTSGYSGDGAAATSAALNQPTTVAIDSAGNLYIADTFNNVIRKVNVSSGIISTIAGNGYQAGTGQGGYSGDGAAATGAELNQPTGVALDSAGDLYISDNANAVIREVNASTGIITTVAGNQPNGPGYGGDGGPATSALFNDPFSVSLDGAGNLYIGDGFNNVVREVNVAAVPTVSYPTSTAVNSTDTTDGSQTVALSNIGNQQLDLSGLTVPANWTQVASGGTDCSSTSQVAMGSTCNLALTFAPTAPGNPLTGSVSITDNSLNVASANQSIGLSGTAIAEPKLVFSTAPNATILAGGVAGAAVTVNEEAFDGSPLTSASDTITLTVTGPNSYSQTYTMTASSGEATFNLSSATLTTAGTYTYTATSGSMTQAVATETVLPDPNGFVSSISFGSSTNVGSAASAQAVSVYFLMAGTVNTVNVLTQGMPGLDFTQAASPNGGTCATGTSYSAGQSCTVNVIFTPKHPGLRFGAVQMIDSHGNVLGQVLLSATGEAPQAALTPGTINTVAGNNGLSGSYSGDGGTATSAGMSATNDVVVDSAGNLYITDAGNSVIRKVDASTGIITTIAGFYNSGGGGYSGDGGPATSAELNAPNGIALDGAGNLYIADSYNNVIREVKASTGVIATIAGGGSPASGNGDGGLATGAVLNTPGGVAVDSAGNLYIADTYDNAIREVNSSTGIITTVAGNGSQGYSGDGGLAIGAVLNQPSQVAIDSAGNLYIADTYNNVIRKVNVSSGIISTIAGNGYQAGTGQGGYSGDGAAATGAELNQPTGVALDSAGDLYISDNANAVIREVNASTGIITTVAGNQPNGPGYGGDGGPATSALLQDPYGAALDGAGNLYIGDGFNGVIRKVNVAAVSTVNYPTSTPVGSTDTTDGAQTVALTNIGNQQLDLSGLTIPASWTQSASGGTDCSSTLHVAAGSACTLALNFTPAMAGNPLTGNATLVDNSLNISNTIQSIPLSGTATQVAQTITFNDPRTQNFGTSPTLTATASSGLAVAFSSTTMGVCTVTSGGSLTFIASGACTIDADQAGNAEYAAAPTVQQSFAVAAVVPGPPTIGTATASAAAGGQQQAMVTFTAPAFTGGAIITGYTATSNPSGLTGTCASSPCMVSGLTAGAGYTFTVTATNSAGTGAPSAATNLVSTSVPNLVVTTAADGAGAASNCTAQSSTATGTDGACSLRDALLFATNAGAAKVYFDSSKFATATTIALTGGNTLMIPSNTTITGATSGSGTTLKNLVTVDGGSGRYGTFSVFAVSSATMNAAIADLTIENGNSGSGFGGGINNQGALQVTSSTLSHNTGFGGGALFNNGTLTVTDSTIYSNAASSGNGGGILNYFTANLTVANSTFYDNSAANAAGGAIADLGNSVKLTDSTISGNAASNSGGISGGSSFTIANSIVAGNTASVNPDGSGGFTDGGGDLIGNGTGENGITNGVNGDIVGSSASPVSPMLTALGSYGGATETMIPLPGSAAICAGGYLAAQTAGIGSDQRGVVFGDQGAGGYCLSRSIDIGAVQTDYSISFTSPISNVVPGIAMNPAPAVTLDEDAAPFTANAVTIPLTVTSNPSGAALTGYSAATNTTLGATAGVATYSSLSVSQAGTNDQLAAKLVLNSSSSVSITAQSSNFDATQIAPTLRFAPSPATQTYGVAISSLTLDAAAYNNGSPVAGSVAYTTTVGGSKVTLTAGSTVLPVGAYTITAVFTPDNSNSATYTTASTTAQYTVTASGLAASVTASNKNYDGTNAATIVSCSLTGVVAADIGKVACSATGASFATKNVGAGITVTATGISLSGTAEANYTLPSTSATTTATITAAPLTITASSGTMTYGAAVPTIAPSYSGFEGSDSASSLTTPPACSTTATSTSPVALYPSSCTGAADPNYTIGYMTGSVRITQAMLTVMAASTGSSYGIVPTVAPAYSGFVAGNTAASLSAVAMCSSTVTATTPVGTYAGANSCAGAADPNYKFTYMAGTATVTQAAQTIVFTPPASPVSYGVAPIVLSATSSSGLGIAFSVVSGPGSITGDTLAVTGAGTIVVAAHQSGNANYVAASPAMRSITVESGMLVIAANNAMRIYGTPNPAFTGTVTGQQYGDNFIENFTTIANLSSAVGTYSIVPSVTGRNLADYTQSVTNGRLTITQAASITTLKASTSSITPGQGVTLTAMVKSATTGTPTGSIGFFDGGVLIGTEPLSGGEASYSTTGLAPGLLHTLTARYEGDANFTASASTASAASTVAVAPLDFTMTLKSPANLTVVPGQSVSFQVEITPDYGSYAGTVRFAMTGLPAGAIATFSPASVPASAGAQMVTVTIQTAPATAAMHLPGQIPAPGRKSAPFALAFLALLGTGTLRKRGRLLRRMLCVVVLAGGVLLALGVSGCAGRGGFFAQPPQTYPVTLTAATANLQQSTTIQLNVQ